MRTVGAALELGMGLGADPERMIFELDELHQPAIRRKAAATKPGSLELRLQLGAELPPAAVPLADDEFAVCPADASVRLEDRVVSTQSLRATLVDHVALIVHQ